MVCANMDGLKQEGKQICGKETNSLLCGWCGMFPKVHMGKGDLSESLPPKLEHERPQIVLKVTNN